jgi:hypothetical protein
MEITVIRQEGNEEYELTFNVELIDSTHCYLYLKGGNKNSFNIYHIKQLEEDIFQAMKKKWIIRPSIDLFNIY